MLFAVEAHTTSFVGLVLNVKVESSGCFGSLGTQYEKDQDSRVGGRESRLAKSISSGKRGKYAADLQAHQNHTSNGMDVPVQCKALAFLWVPALDMRPGTSVHPPKIIANLFPQKEHLCEFNDHGFHDGESGHRHAEFKAKRAQGLFQGSRPQDLGQPLASERSSFFPLPICPAG